ncbi:MAG: SNF2 family helicase [Clostridiales bacterium]|nr:SNF2 family helicase [Clostridiales bacterium]
MELNLTEFGIRRFINDGQEFFLGRKKAQEGKVKGVRFVDGDNIKFAGKVVDENPKGEYLAEVCFDINGSPSSCRCTCGKGIRCRHCAALLFELMSDKGSHSGDLSANYVASKNFLDMLEKLRLEDMRQLSFAAAEKIKIEPDVYFSPQRAELALYIVKKGRRKKPIEDIFEFAINVDRNTGKNYRDYGYNINGFTDDSKKILNFIYSHSEIKAGFIALSNLSEDKSRFILSEVSLDSFFDLFSKSRLSAVENEEKFKLNFREEVPLIFIEAAASDGKVKIKKNFKPRGVYITNTHGYILLENTFYRTSVDYACVIRDIEAAFNIAGGKEITFETSDLGRFVDYCIPVLCKYDLLKEPGKIFDSLSMTPFKSQIFLERRGKALCGRVKYIYGDTVIDYNDKSAYREYRNDRAETVFKLGLEGMGFYDNGSEGFLMTSEDDIFSFMKYGISALKKNTEVFLSEDLKAIRKSAEKTISIGVRYEGGLIDAEFDLSTINLDEMKEVLSAYEYKKKYYRFSDGRFLSIDDNKTFLKFIKFFSPSKSELSKGSYKTGASRLIVFDRLFDEGEKSSISFDKASRGLIERFNELKGLDLSVPQYYKGILRDYQKEGFKWLKSVGECGFGGVLADDMGLGKTVQVISYLYDKYDKKNIFDGEEKPSLVVCPTSLIFNWEAELETFGGGLKYEIVYGSGVKRKEILKKKTQIFVASYETVKRDFEIYKNMDFAVILADEAQFIKNRATRSFTALTALKSEVRFAVTGTPFENSLSELWSVFEFIMPGYLGSYKSFVTNFEKPIVKNNDRSKMTALQKLISPFVLRREKGDVLRDLPEKTEIYRYTLMTDEQSKLYKAELLKARGMIRTDIEGNKINRIKILSEITRLRQICCHPSLFLEGYKGESGKLDYLMENLGGLIERGHKVLIFSQFTSMLAIIKDKLSLRGIEYFYIDGSTPPPERLERVNEFNSGNKAFVFLISLKAGGTGLNLTGADTVIHFDQWWNPAVMEQASDRAHRFGQIRRVNVYSLITKNTIEEKILKLQKKKKQLFNDVLNLETGFLSDMTEEDILDLFS